MSFESMLHVLHGNKVFFIVIVIVIVIVTRLNLVNGIKVSLVATISILDEVFHFILSSM